MYSYNNVLNILWEHLNKFEMNLTILKHLNIILIVILSIGFVTKVGAWKKKQVGKVFETQAHFHKCERVQRMNSNTYKWIFIFK